MNEKALKEQSGGGFGSRSLGTWITLGVSILALALALRGANIREAVSALAQPDPLLIVMASVLAVLANVATALRWRELLHPYRPSPGRLFQVLLISHLGNTVLPWKLGTFLRTYLVADVEDIALSFAMGTVAVERLLDALVLVLWFLAVLPRVPLPRWLHDSGFNISVTVLLLFLGLVIVVYLRPYALAGSRRYITVARLPAPIAWLTSFLKQGMRSLEILARPGQYLSIVLWTFASWSAGAVVNGLVLRAMEIQVPAWAPVVLLVTLQIGNKVPTAPANLGIFHYVATITLGLFGVDKTSALSYAVVLHAVVFLVPAVVGALCLWKWQRDFGNLHLQNMFRRIQKVPQELS